MVPLCFFETEPLNMCLHLDTSMVLPLVLMCVLGVWLNHGRGGENVIINFILFYMQYQNLHLQTFISIISKIVWRSLKQLWPCLLINRSFIILTLFHPHIKYCIYWPLHNDVNIRICLMLACSLTISARSFVRSRNKFSECVRISRFHNKCTVKSTCDESPFNIEQKLVAVVSLTHEMLYFMEIVKKEF